MMRLLTKCLLAVGLFTFAVTADAGTLSGKVSYSGKAPKPEVIKMNADPVCVKQNAGKPVMKEDLLSSNGGLEYVFVYVKEGLKAPAAANTTPVTFDQHGCHYVPHVFGIQVNQPLKIVNSDPTLHNVHSLAKNNTNFNMGMATVGQAIERKFAKPEVMIRIKCDVHGWMNAYAGVLDHPYFAVSDAKGAFSIKDLPAGEYTLEAWHEKLGTKTQKVTVTDAGAKAEFKF